MPAPSETSCVRVKPGGHIPELAAPDIAAPAEATQAFRDTSSERITLKRIRLSGAPDSLSVPVDPVLKKYTGKPLSFADLRTLSAELTRQYRDAGLMYRAGDHTPSGYP